MASMTCRELCCPICSAAAGERFELKSVHVAGTCYTILQCDDCGHHFAQGPIDNDTLARVYGDGFHSSTQQDGSNTSPVVINARRRAAQLAAAGLRGRLLDVGAGKGHFVEAAGVSFDAVGLEASDGAASAARRAGRRVETGMFPQQSPPGCFDVITLWDVLAGISDLHAAIAALRERLVPGGRLVFTVPWVSAPFARWTGRRWPLWIPPVNLHYFTPHGLTKLLQSHGLRIMVRNSESKHIAVDFLVRKALQCMGLATGANRLKGIPAGWSVKLDLGDIMTVHAQRLP